jgi:UDP-4-amino-4,6-dideoxy-N-acetyl-beta-L-altrosamine N-acetyltransferase
MYSQHIITLKEHTSWFERIKDSEEVECFIYEDEDSVSSGFVSFSKINRYEKSAHWGFYKAPEAKSGTGTNLGIDALNYFFFEKKMKKLIGEAISTNLGSIKFHQKLGFKKEGTLPNYYFTGKEYIDIIQFIITFEDWKDKKIFSRSLST